MSELGSAADELNEVVRDIEDALRPYYVRPIVSEQLLRDGVRLMFARDGIAILFQVGTPAPVRPFNEAPLHIRVGAVDGIPELWRLVLTDHATRVEELRSATATARAFLASVAVDARALAAAITKEP